MDDCLLCCEVLQESIQCRNFYRKGITCMRWRLDWTQTNLLLFGFSFQTGFIAHSFCKSPLNILLLIHSRKRCRKWFRWWWWWQQWWWRRKSIPPATFIKVKTFKVARPSILKGTPSISESLILSFVIFGIFVCNALCYVLFGWLYPAVRSFTQIYKRNFEISWNFYRKGINYAFIKTGLNTDKFATFWMFS